MDPCSLGRNLFGFGLWSHCQHCLPSGLGARGFCFSVPQFPIPNIRERGWNCHGGGTVGKDKPEGTRQALGTLP